MADFHHFYRTTDRGESLCYVWFPAMHTRADILMVNGGSEADGCKVAEEVVEELIRLERVANCFCPTSELAQVNRGAARSVVPLSDTLRELLEQCQHYNGLTGGLFDITTDSEPFGADCARAVQISAVGVRFKRMGVRLNLSGYLKGYALDRIRQVLRLRGVGNALVSLGTSSVMALGQRHGVSGWPVTLPGGGECIELSNECLTTSGNDNPGRRHIVNPHTGHYVEGVRTVSVVTECGALGEVMSTSLFIATPQQRTGLCQRFAVKHWYVAGDEQIIGTNYIFK